MLKCCKNDKIRVTIYIYPLFWASSTKTIPDLLLIKLSFFSWTSWMRDQCWTVSSFTKINKYKLKMTSYEFDEEWDKGMISLICWSFRPDKSQMVFTLIGKKYIKTGFTPCLDRWPLEEPLCASPVVIQAFLPLKQDNI